MSSVVQQLTKKELIRPPSFLPTNTMYEVLMGSHAYGVADTSGGESDWDIYGWAIPPKELIFFHLAGEIQGFGRQIKRFEQFQQHHVFDENALGGKGREYDLSIYNIVKFFQLAMKNTPNMIDALYVPQECVLHITQTGNMVREQRKIFLHKGCFHTLKGYAFSQLHKARSKNPQGKRKELRDKFGCDTKFLYHVVRLLDQCEQILEHGDLNLQRAKEHMKAVRRGEVSEEEIRKWFDVKEKELEKLYNREDSPVPYKPDEAKIKNLLLQCLEHHYGSLDKCVVNPDAAITALREVQEVLERHKGLL